MTVNKKTYEITNVSRPYYIESYRKGTVDELYQRSEIYNRK